MKKTSTNNQSTKKDSFLNRAIQRLFNDSSPKVSFLLQDGTVLNQSIKKEFLLSENGKRRSTYNIKNDLYALKHDNQAIGFRI